MLLRANKKHASVRSIEEAIGVDKDGSELSIQDVIPQEEEKDPDIIVEKSMTMENIKKIMKSELNAREYEIIELRYGLIDGVELTQREVAVKLGISRSYVSRIENKALEILKLNLVLDSELEKTD